MHKKKAVTLKQGLKQSVNSCYMDLPSYCRLLQKYSSKWDKRKIKQN